MNLVYQNDNIVQCSCCTNSGSNKTEIFLNLLNDNWLLKRLPLHTCSLFHRIHPGSSLKCSTLKTLTFKISDTVHWHTLRHAGQEIEKVQTVSHMSVSLPTSAPIKMCGDTLYVVHITKHVSMCILCREMHNKKQFTNKNIAVTWKSKSSTFKSPYIFCKFCSLYGIIS